MNIYHALFQRDKETLRGSQRNRNGINSPESCEFEKFARLGPQRSRALAGAEIGTTK